MGTAGLRHRPGLIVPVAFPTARGLIERLHSTGHEVAGNFPEAVDPAGTKPAPDDAEASKPRPGALFARLRQLNGVPSANVSVGADMLHEARARDQAGLCAVGLAGRSFSGRPNIQPVHFVHFASQALQTFTYLGRDGLMRYIALSLALLITGCALATATPPKVEVAAVELRGLGLLDQTLGVTLCVTNLNNTELDFRRVTVELEVAGAPLAESASETPVRLPPRSSVLVPFTVATTLRSLGPQVLDVLRSGGIEYQVRGRVQLDGALAISLPFSRSGRLDLLAAGARLLSLRGQLDLLAGGARLLADTAAAAASDTSCASTPSS